MNEGIGEKGGANDLKKERIIKEVRMKKEEQDLEDQEIKELEEKLKKKRLYTLVRTIPLVIGGTALRAFYEKNKVKKELKIEKREEKKKEKKQLEKEVETKEPIEEPTLISIKEEFFELKKKKKEKEQEEKKSIEKVPEEIEILTLEEEEDEINFSNLPVPIKEKLEKIKSRKIVEEYENTLKEIRYELRNTIRDYQVVKEDRPKSVPKVEKLLDKLSTVIDKIEELKRKINIKNIDQYDDNYIYYLIESTFQEFEKGKIVDDLKDSPLYITIASKVDEINKKKISLDKEVNEKKVELELKQKDFEEIKKGYYSIDQFNKDLLMFQYDQDRILKEVQEKVRTAKTVKERAVTEVQAMDRQSKRLLRLLTFQMLLPSPKFTKGFASSAAAYLYFVNKIVKPKTTVKKYQVILVKDYSDEILYSIENLESTLKVLKKTSYQIDKMIIEIKDKFKGYQEVIPEVDDIIRNLKKIKQEMEEKEYEIKRIKKEQELELEKNNAKVKTRGEYPVN